LIGSLDEFLINEWIFKEFHEGLGWLKAIGTVRFKTFSRTRVSGQPFDFLREKWLERVEDLLNVEKMLLES
jgi:hypothetical protein